MTGNTASGDGGGVFAVGHGRQVRLSGRTTLVAANTTGFNGGGIATNNCKLVIRDGVQVHSNTAGENGGGVAVLAGNFARPGGGAPIVLLIDGTFDEESTVSIRWNVATNGDGGGLYVENVTGAPPTAQLAGVTINENRADGPVGGLTTGRGGGIAAFGALVLDGDDSVLVSGNFQRTDAGVLGAYLDPGVGGTFATDAIVFGNFLLQGGPNPTL